VSSTSGPYPRPRSPRRATRKIWLAAVGAAIVLGLTWVLFMSGEEAGPPPPPPLPQDASTSPAVTDHSPAKPTGEALDFAPVPGHPKDEPETIKHRAEPAEATDPAETAELAETADQAEADEPIEPAEPAEAAEPAAATVEISDKWVVNISSTPDEAESQRFLSTLSGQDVGGRVYTSQAIVEGRLQHRIRVGFFDTREEAEAVGLKIKEHFKLNATPWAVRPYKSEEENQGGR